MIDAAAQQVGPAGHHLLQGQLHAVNRCARAGPNAEAGNRAEPAEPDWLHGRNGTGRTRAGRVGSDHNYVAQLLHQRRELLEALSMHSIVVCNQYKGLLFHK